MPCKYYRYRFFFLFCKELVTCEYGLTLFCEIHYPKSLVYPIMIDT